MPMSADLLERSVKCFTLWCHRAQARDVDSAYVGRGAIFPWEAKVYTLANTP
jgi:hypothetical protein